MQFNIVQYHCHTLSESFVVWSYQLCPSALQIPLKLQVYLTEKTGSVSHAPKRAPSSAVNFASGDAWMDGFMWGPCGFIVRTVPSCCLEPFNPSTAWLKPHLNIWIKGTQPAVNTICISLYRHESVSPSSLASPRYLAKSGLSKLLHIRVSGAEAC